MTRTLSWLAARTSQRNVEGMARYGITATKVYGVSMATMRPLIRSLGRNHDLALALWESGWYEARILASFVDEPDRVTPAQMERWVKAFDSWALCDNSCFHLFDRTPHAWTKIERWAGRKDEFVKRAAFALLAGIAVHHKKESDERFLSALRLIERAATDERNFVKKGVSWALRSIGHRNPALMAACEALASSLAASPNATARWIGRDALRDLGKARERWRAKRR